MARFETSRLPGAVALFVIAGLLAVMALVHLRERARPPLTTPYQAVILTNGQTLFGKLEKAGSDYPVLGDVFYIRNETNPETKQMSMTLVKRGKEWHEPDYTTINAAHILLIEPVKPESRLGKLIAEYKNR
jgi:hypothetical protein